MVMDVSCTIRALSREISRDNGGIAENSLLRRLRLPHAPGIQGKVHGFLYPFLCNGLEIDLQQAEPFGRGGHAKLPSISGCEYGKESVLSHVSGACIHQGAGNISYHVI